MKHIIAYDGTSEFGYGIVKESVKYKFTALCTSDICRTRKIGTTKSNVTDVGTEKIVPKTQDMCPDCGFYLFWSKVIA